jgi:signal transduction histidine kinase
MSRRPATSDVLIALAAGLEMQAELFLAGDAPRRDVLIARVGLLALAVALLLRRRVPVAAAALCIASITLVESRGDDVSSQLVVPFFAMLLVSYSVGRHSEGRELAAGAAVLVLGSVAAVRLDEPPGGIDDVFFATTVLTGGPVVVGRMVHARSRLNRALREKAEAVERDRAARAAGAVAEERARIAGELHHLVSDALASMVGQAGAAEQLVRTKPEIAERAFASVEETGREALTEIRRLLGVLRRDDEELALAPQPSLAHVRDLIARVRLPVELVIEGAEAPLPAGVDLTAYRVIQEALGAPAAHHATVRVHYADDAVALEVRGLGDARPELLGVRERVALYGGDLVAEPVAGSGYAVRARLPVERVA